MPELLQLALRAPLAFALFGVGSFLCGVLTLQKGWYWVASSAVMAILILSGYSIYLIHTNNREAALEYIIATAVILFVLTISQKVMQRLPPWIRCRRLHWTRKE